MLAFPAVLLEINSISDDDALIVAFPAELDPVKSIIRASKAAIEAFPAELLPLKTNPLMRGRLMVVFPAVLVPLKNKLPAPPTVMVAFPAVLELLKVIELPESLQLVPGGETHAVARDEFPAVALLLKTMPEGPTEPRLLTTNEALFELPTRPIPLISRNASLLTSKV